MEQIECAKTPLLINPIYVTAGLQNPKAQEIIAAFTKGMEIIKANGTYDKICKNYGMKKTGRQQQPRKLVDCRLRTGQYKSVTLA